MVGTVRSCGWPPPPRHCGTPPVRCGTPPCSFICRARLPLLPPQEAAWRAKKEEEARLAKEAAAAAIAAKEEEDRRKAADAVAEIKAQYENWREGAGTKLEGRWKMVPAVRWLGWLGGGVAGVLLLLLLLLLSDGVWAGAAGVVREGRLHR